MLNSGNFKYSSTYKGAVKISLHAKTSSDHLQRSIKNKKGFD